MESLAFAVVLIVLGTLVCAVVSAFATWRPPSALFARVTLVPFAAVALLSGARFALLPIGIAMRIAGALMAAQGAAALYRLAKGHERER